MLTFVQDDGGSFWSIDWDGMLTYPKSFPLPLDNVKYSGIFRDPQGDIYIGSETGLVLHVKDPTKNPSLERIETGLFRIHDFCVAADGQVWVCSDFWMGYLADGAFYTAAGARIKDSIESIIADYEGSIWAASSRSGLLQIIPTKITNISFLANLGTQIFISALEYNDDLYIASDNRLFILDTPSPAWARAGSCISAAQNRSDPSIRPVI